MKNVFKYLEATKDMLYVEEGDFYREFNGNDMVLAINTMQEKGDWKNFEEYKSSVYALQCDTACVCDKCEDYQVWLFGKPQNFFLFNGGVDK